MSNILICYDPNKIGMTDFERTDYLALNNRVQTECKGKWPNFGNKVWLQGIFSALSTPENQLEFGYESVNPKEVNERFDCVVMPLANCFHKNWIPWLKTRAEFVEQVKIPVFVIACGAQANSYDDLNQLVNDVREPATRFINSVYATGGEFALRGYFTEEFFKKLGFNHAVVTGCPSMYQMGRSLSISNNKVSADEFKPAINGTFKLPLTDKSVDSADFVCQGNYGNMLYNPKYFSENKFDNRRILKLIKRGDYSFVKALAQGRIHMFAYLEQWYSFFRENNISFSFGSRIHGTVVPILACVPSMITPCDTRTREMAEFFDIPVFNSDGKKLELFELYQSVDYSAFNKSFANRFDAFERFLKNCGLVDRINQQNIFIKNDYPEKPVIINQKELDRINKMLKRNSLIYFNLNRHYNHA